MTTEEAKKAVHDAYVCGWIALGISILLTMIYFYSPRGWAAIDPWNAVDILLLAVLTVGLYYKSRFAAVAMLIYFLGSKIVLWVSEQAFIGVPLALVISYFFWRGVRGTFILHQARNSAEELLTNN